MAKITDYASLQTEIGNMLDRDDLTADIPLFVQLAKSRIDTDVRIRRMEKRVTADVTDEFVTLPSDYIEMRAVNLNVRPAKRLQGLTPGQIAERYPREPGTGEPWWYAINGDSIQLWPKPDGTYEVELIYVGTLTDFESDADTNWLLENHPGVYLYGALIAAEPFLANDQRIQTWSMLYQENVDRVNRMADEGRYGPSLKMTSRRMTP